MKTVAELLGWLEKHTKRDIGTSVLDDLCWMLAYRLAETQGDELRTKDIAFYFLEGLDPIKTEADAQRELDLIHEEFGNFYDENDMEIGDPQSPRKRSSTRSWLLI